MQPVGIKVEPISTYLERRQKGPIYPVVVAGGTVYVSGLPPFDPVTGDVRPRPFIRGTGGDRPRANEEMLDRSGIFAGPSREVQYLLRGRHVAVRPV